MVSMVMMEYGSSYGLAAQAAPAPSSNEAMRVRFKMFLLPLTETRVEGIAQPVAHHVDGQHEDDERGARKHGDPPFPREQEVVADADEGAERRLRRRHADPQERQRGFGDD